MFSQKYSKTPTICRFWDQAKLYSRLQNPQIESVIVCSKWDRAVYNRVLVRRLRGHRLQGRKLRGHILRGFTVS